MENKKKATNLDFWESVEKTNPNHTKAVTAGKRSLTAINAQQQLRDATEKWGMYGKTWGLKDIQLNYVNNLCNDQVLAVAQGIFYYPDGQFEIGSSIFVQQYYATKKYSSVDDDFLKKLETDMTTKSLSKLGFNADVFLGYYDDNKYVTKMQKEFNKKPKLDATGMKYLKSDEATPKDWNNALRFRDLTEKQRTEIENMLTVSKEMNHG